MSLKAFHIFFIAVSILLAFGFGVWGVYSHVAHTSVQNLVMGILSLGVGVGLVVYGVRMVRRLRQI